MAVKHRSGFSLVELLVALAIAVVVLGLVARLLLHARQADRAVAEASERRASAALALDQLRHSVARAGTAPWPRPSMGPTPGPGLVLTVDRLAPSGDAVSVRYAELDAAGDPLERAYRFDARRDGRGTPTLYRTPAGSVRQPWVAGVERMVLLGWVDAAGVHDRRAWGSGPLEPRALLLGVDVGGRTWVDTVPLPGRPVTRVDVVP